jgi:preprotein translocase subunit SecY
MTADLRRRIGFTLGALLVYRIGTYIPLPGIDAAAWAQIFRTPGSGVAGTLSSSTAIRNLAIFSLGLTPYLSAAIFLQLVMIVSRRLRAVRERGEAGRRALVRYTLYLAAPLTLVQAYGVATGIEAIPNLVANAGWMFRITTMVTLAGGAFFLVWLSDQITARGIGNGLALILLLDVILGLPAAAAATFQLARQGVLSGGAVFGLVAFAFALTGLIVFMELARRRVPVTYARRPGTQTIESRSYLAVKLNSAGAVIPPLLASWIMLLLTGLAYLAGVQGGAWWQMGTTPFGYGRLAYVGANALAILASTFVYAAFVLDPEEVAKSLGKYGGTISGVEPGEATAAYLDGILTRTTIFGALYLAAIYLVPEVLASYAQVPFYLGGPSLLLVVCAIMDIDSQVRDAPPQALSIGG